MFTTTIYCTKTLKVYFKKHFPPKRCLFPTETQKICLAEWTALTKLHCS